ncbi:iron chaperone [Chitinophaga niabensis]|uniref:Uncharacterized conserved protein YdhG, YjbR/CyaY-like superfamily, DUF1801 family n=1 Tax=Chitinophaga niabensis TaxID=536979 RepID=A0A1N6FNQ9_9BACT|nr:DUF1801 domain-containing protein [Chitinophaga niabensis]SIN96884.1 Uncharacterized conserved protein YdhG, YjbR/CyaY-like superfamily, DUF1801 family [Chitinophaga niabensis]
MKAKDIDAYIAGFPREVREPLKEIRAAIKMAAPSLEEAIKYDMPTFMLDGKNLFHFAAFKHHISFFGATVENEELAPYKHGKGTLQFPLNKPMPLDLVSRIVTAKINQRNI